MIQLPKYHFRIGVANYISNTGSFGGFTGASVSRSFPPISISLPILSAGEVLVYETRLEDFEIGDVLDLNIEYKDAEGNNCTFTYKKEIKVI